MAPASTATIGFSLRRLWAWISFASTSLPVPFSPVMSTVASVGAILSRVFRMAAMGMAAMGWEAPQNMGFPVKPGMTLASVMPDRLPVMPDPDRASRPIDFLALSRAAVRTSMSLSFSQGFTRKSKAPRFMPSTARAMSA